MINRKLLNALCFAGMFALAVPTLCPPVAAQAKKTATKPKGATAQCKDGSYSTAKSKQGACAKHGGVATWYADTKEPPAAATKPAPKTAATAPPNATGQCKDGTYTTAKTRQGACGNHGGVATWIAAESAPAKGQPSTPVPPAPSKAAPPPPAPPRATATNRPSTPAAQTPANATARCKDGTFSYAKQHRGACSRHSGVAEWFK